VLGLIRATRTGSALGPRRAVGVALAGCACTVSILWGFWTRGESDLTAEEGLGYGLGVAGLAMMVALLLYSLRKRVRILRNLAPLGLWFEVHMMLGLLGPTAILFHSNFSLGSLNSSVALFCMLFVAGSGVAGRFIYTRIHHGLLGQRATAGGLRQGASERRRSFAQALDRCPRAADELDRFESYALRSIGGTWESIQRFATLRYRAHRARRRSEQIIAEDLGQMRLQEFRVDLAAYFQAVHRASQLGGYERLFSMWHAFHLPLCLLLFASAAAHVVAVHLY